MSSDLEAGPSEGGPSGLTPGEDPSVQMESSDAILGKDEALERLMTSSELLAYQEELQRTTPEFDETIPNKKTDSQDSGFSEGSSLPSSQAGHVEEQSSETVEGEITPVTTAITSTETAAATGNIPQTVTTSAKLKPVGVQIVTRPSASGAAEVIFVKQDGKESNSGVAQFASMGHEVPVSGSGAFIPQGRYVAVPLVPLRRSASAAQPSTTSSSQPVKKMIIAGNLSGTAQAIPTKGVSILSPVKNQEGHKGKGGVQGKKVQEGTRLVMASPMKSVMAPMQLVASRGQPTVVSLPTTSTATTKVIFNVDGGDPKLKGQTGFQPFLTAAQLGIPQQGITHGKVQFLRVVSAPGTTQTILSPAQQSLEVLPIISQGSTFKIPSHPQQGLLKAVSAVGSTQRVLVPFTTVTQPKPLAPRQTPTSSTVAFSTLSLASPSQHQTSVPVTVKEEPDAGGMEVDGETILGITDGGKESEIQSSDVLSSGGDISLVPVPQTEQEQEATSGHPHSGHLFRPRKVCNCTKSRCLKLYCECFASGEFCTYCNCLNCANNIEHEDERHRAISMCLERNPQAFKPKIGKAMIGEGHERVHTKGCHCKRSGCLKNYCECFEAKILCSAICKCVGCRNQEDELGSQRRMLLDLAEAAEVKRQERASVKCRLFQDKASVPRAVSISTNLYSINMPDTRGPWECITADVIEATVQCMLAEAQEAENRGDSPADVEATILGEFGRCLNQIIDHSRKMRDTPPLSSS
ncbi:unnamed protein product [Darwinula stevensoni]|uniref:CRC domain-containing protein n=1 Tax=Darwinula stevensoni TaxID=69355 RepID=A0A7R9A513_9CRUS|nr:unnamed protein product [Darwinula stevensoni]CAG0894686.1 unnamed protein product [Darwinula stevensoni]